MTRKLLVAVAAVTGGLCAVPSAHALTSSPVWKCRASPTYASVNGQNRVEPVVANGNINTAVGANPDHAQCANAETGAGNTATQLGISQDVLGARTGQAKTEIAPELGRAITQRVTATAKVEDLNLSVPAGSPPLLGVKAATSSATGSCVSGETTPRLDGTSQVADLTVLGAPIGLDGLVGALTSALQPLGFLVDVKINERVPTPDGLTVRALHVKVIRGNGTTPVVDLVVAESKVGFDGAVCDPAAQDGNGSRSPCPPGSEYDSAQNVCIIRASTTGSSLGDIVVGPPFSGPSGGTVVPLDVARRRYGRSPCLSGSGNPKFAIVGTNRNDRITGTNVADRIIGLGGNDSISGGRGNDCLEGRNGRDILSGSLGNDSVYGQAGNDALNGGGGNDRLSGGSGNDTINGGYGADRTFGGPGSDAINIATQGPRATADCGTGSGDKVRFNNKERTGIRNCETRYLIRDR